MKDEKMTREEALQSIKELESYVKNLSSNNHPATLKAGQLYKKVDGWKGTKATYMYTCRGLLCVDASDRSLVGRLFDNACDPFSGEKDNFVYMGMITAVQYDATV